MIDIFWPYVGVLVSFKNQKGTTVSLKIIEVTKRLNLSILNLLSNEHLMKFQIISKSVKFKNQMVKSLLCEKTY